MNNSRSTLTKCYVAVPILAKVAEILKNSQFNR